MNISIITVTYNSEETLKDSIESVLSQDYMDFELIIIDGASTDSTLSILTNYDHSSLKYISEPDSGIYDAINKGLKLAKGDIVGILNSDDFFADQNVLSRIAREFQKDLSLEAVYADVIFVERFNISKKIRYYSSKKFRKAMFRFGFQPAHPTFYVKRALFEKYGYYRTDLKIAGDFELLLRFLYVYKVRVKYVNDLWVKMRVGGVSTSGLKSIIQLNSEILKACKTNKVYSNFLMIYSKYAIKWWGFVSKNNK